MDFRLADPNGLIRLNDRLCVLWGWVHRILPDNSLENITKTSDWPKENFNALWFIRNQEAHT